jgi:hypothetical protein
MQRKSVYENRFVRGEIRWYDHIVARFYRLRRRVLWAFHKASSSLIE